MEPYLNRVEHPAKGNAGGDVLPGESGKLDNDLRCRALRPAGFFIFSGQEHCELLLKVLPVDAP